MSRKAFHIGVDLDIHAVTCPGVWLCPKGEAMLEIFMLRTTVQTKRVEPNFPLLFHEKFHFRRTLTDVTTLSELQADLAKRVFRVRLVQWQVHGFRRVLLAAFRCPLTDLLYPQTSSRGLLAGVDLDLLMEPMPCFPGIIAPKVEVSTKVVVEEMVNYPLQIQQSSIVVNPKTLTSKKTPNKNVKKAEAKSNPKKTEVKNIPKKTEAKRALSAPGGEPPKRQKPVCHVRPQVKCYSCKQRVTRVQKWVPVDEDTHYVPYCINCAVLAPEGAIMLGKIVVKGTDLNAKRWEMTCPCVESPRPKPVCDCSLCRRYYNMFKNSPPDSVLSQLPKSPSSKLDCCSPDKGCPIFRDKSEGPPRLRAGTAQPKSECPCMKCPSLKNSSANIGEYINELLKRSPSRDTEYYEMLKADLDTRYKKLYERVSRRHNRR